jgi:hypothetical protein
MALSQIDFVSHCGNTLIPYYFDTNKTDELQSTADLGVPKIRDNPIGLSSRKKPTTLFLFFYLGLAGYFPQSS